MPDFASLGIRISTDGVASGAAELDQLAVSAERAEGAAQGVGPAYSVASQQMQASAAAARTSAAGFAVQANQMRMAGLSAGQYSMAMRLLPMQITDIVTGLASGQPAFMVAIQQGGQLRDSFGGFGNTLRALGSLITPARLAIGGLAGAGALLLKAYHDAQRENFELNKQIIISGNVAGVTAGQLAVMADAIDDIAGTRRGASETLGQLAASGRIAADDLQEFAIAATLIARTLDQPVEETVKILSALGKEPVDAAVKLNEKTNFLTKSVYDQIVALERRGEIEKAGALAQNTYIDEFLRRVGIIEGKMPVVSAAVRGTADAFRELGDAATGIFLPQELEQRLRDLQARREKEGRDLFGGRGYFTGTAQNLRDIEERNLINLREQNRREAEKRAADARAIAQAERDRAEKDARIKAQRSIDDAVSASRAESVQRDLDDSLAQYSAYEAQLEAQRDAGLISLEDYYSERRKLINQNIDAQIEALESENRLLEAQRARVQERARADADKADPAERAKIEADAQVKLIELERQRLENISRLSRLEGERISQVNVLATQEQSAYDKIARAIDDARQSAESYLRTLQQGQQRQLDSFGLGDRQREIARELSNIDERFEQQRQQLARDLRRGDIEQDQYERELQIINEFHRRALDSTQNYYEQLAELEGDFSLGARQGLANYLDSARNVAEQSERLFTNAFQGMEDALVDFAVTGKSSFKDFAQSIIADLLRIQLRAAVLRIFGSIAGSGVSAFGGTGAGMGGFDPTAPHAGNGPAMFADTGIMRVPRDNQPTVLHKDEAVLPRHMNPWAGGRSPFGGGIQFGPTYISGGGLSVAQIDELIKQRNAESEARILQGLSSGRYEVSN